MGFHDELIIDDIHIIHNFEYADATARTGASGFVAGDVGKVAKQIDDLSWWILSTTAPTWKPLTEEVASGQIDIIDKVFNFNDASPIDFGTLKNGDEIVNAELEITTVFDDAAALVTLGQTTSTGNILNSAQIDPLTLGTYHNGENFKITGADGVRIQIVPGTSTQGQGRAVVTIRRA